jgi:hypothetical protein
MLAAPDFLSSVEGEDVTVPVPAIPPASLSNAVQLESSVGVCFVPEPLKSQASLALF